VEVDFESVSDLEEGEQVELRAAIKNSAAQSKPGGNGNARIESTSLERSMMLEPSVRFQWAQACVADETAILIDHQIRRQTTVAAPALRRPPRSEPTCRRPATPVRDSFCLR
jgi:hypothetical protein